MLECFNLKLVISNDNNVLYCRKYNLVKGNKSEFSDIKRFNQN